MGPVTRADTEHIAPIGNAPTMMTLDQMKSVMPLFFNLSIAVHNDPEAAKEWGWVQVRVGCGWVWACVGVCVCGWWGWGCE